MAQQLAKRLELQAFLVGLLESENVYFQPPPTVQMKYPCIIYRRDDVSTDYANDYPYRNRIRYQLTFVSRDPDDETNKKLMELQLCAFDRFYTADGLNHDVYNLYF